LPNEEQKSSVSVRSSDLGHWVEWVHNGEDKSLGPYQDAQMAENVRAAKERELRENAGHHIDDSKVLPLPQAVDAKHK
jgi:hypothetical protein